MLARRHQRSISLAALQCRNGARTLSLNKDAPISAGCSGLSDTFSQGQFSADCTIATFGFHFRQEPGVDWGAGVSRRRAAISVVLLAQAVAAAAQDRAPPSASGAVSLPTIDVFSTTPLSWSGIDVDKVPAEVSTVDSSQIQSTRSPNVATAIDQFVPSASTTASSGNQFQPDVAIRGFIASPVAGTPEGVAVYQNGFRVNEAFGDNVNWDLIPTIAVRSMDIISNNPAFGLNALGGAVSIQMKNGFTSPGGSLDVMGGSYGRIQSSLQWGKQVDNVAAYGALEVVRDNGFRDFGASLIRRIYGDVGVKGDTSEFHLSIGGAQNTFGSSAAAPIELLDQSWSSVYTTPQTFTNQMGVVQATGHVQVTPNWAIDGAAYVRMFSQQTVDGNSTDAQPCADPTLLCFGDGVTPANGVNGARLANGFPSMATLGEIDRTSTHTTTLGLSLQAKATDQILGHANTFVIGGTVDYSRTRFDANAELGVIDPLIYVDGSGIYLGPSGNPVSDGPVALNATNVYTGLYALDTIDVTNALSVTAGARANFANIQLDDLLGGSLTGNHTYDHFNPLIGATYRITSEITAYGGFSVANRTPTPLELGCSDPNHPCVIGSFLIADPTLKQVIAETYEAGLRGTHEFGAGGGLLSWKLGVFRTDTADDILNVPSPFLPGFGYFTNVGATRRQGVEVEFRYHTDTIEAWASYSYIDATFLNSFLLASNSPYADTNGNIQVSPGDQLPMIPKNQVKASISYKATPALKLSMDMQLVGAQRYVGDESNQAALLPAYAFFNAGASYQVTPSVEIYAQVENIFDHRYGVYGTFFATQALTPLIAFTDPRTIVPAQPRSFYAGVKATF
jgi:outer membrane receptor protein involved in Fe transport